MKDINLAKKNLEDLRENYNKIAEDYSSKRKFFNEGEDQIYLKFLRAGDKVLDAGCGSGRLLSILTGRDIDYTGVDPSENLLKEARKNYPGFNFLEGDILSLDFEPNSFDVVFCIRVLHHIPSRELQRKALERLQRALKPGGYLIITVWNLWKKIVKDFLFFRFTKKPRWFTFKDLLVPWGNNAVRYYYAFSLSELKKLVKDTGFEIVYANYLKEGKKVNIFSKGPTNIVIVARKP